MFSYVSSLFPPVTLSSKYYFHCHFPERKINLNKVKEIVQGHM